MKKTIQELNRRLKGYNKRVYKHRYLLLQGKILTDREFILFVFCRDTLADWDIEHGDDKYGTFTHSQADIARMLGWSERKVSEVINTLIEKGFLKRMDGKVEVLYFVEKNLSELEYPFPIAEEYITKMKDLLPKEDSPFPTDNVPIVEAPRSKESLGSFKGMYKKEKDISLSPEDVEFVNNYLE